MHISPPPPAKQELYFTTILFSFIIRTDDPFNQAVLCVLFGQDLLSNKETTSMNITNRDVLELRRRLTKKSCTFDQMCGCYVDSNKQILLKFNDFFQDLEDQEYFKYLEIAKKVLSGSLGNALLELEFNSNDTGTERQQFLQLLKSSKLQNEALLDRLYEQIIANYSNCGNYLILVFHDVYDVISKTSDHNRLDESQEIYEHMICAVCPVELSKPGLGYREDENRIGVRERDWIVNLPELGFLYPAFSDRSSDIHSVMYYVKNGKNSHPEFVTDVLGCTEQRTATEEKETFHSIIKDAFGEDEQHANSVFLQIQKELNGIVMDCEEQEVENPVPLTLDTVSAVLEENAVPAEIQQRVTQSYASQFGDTPPVVQNVVDTKLLAASNERKRAAELEVQVQSLQQQLEESTAAAPDVSNEADSNFTASTIVLNLPSDQTNQVHAQMIDGQKCLVIPIENGQITRINGVETEL